MRWLALGWLLALVALAPRPSTAADDAARWSPTPEGFVNRWLATGPLTDPAGAGPDGPVDALVAAVPSASWRVLAAPGPALDLEPARRARKRDPTRVHLLAADLHVAAPGTYRLRSSVSGRMDLWVDGVRVATSIDPKWLVLDDRHVDVDLAAGRHEVVVRLEQLPPGPLRFALRVRTPDNQPPAGLAWSLPAAAPTVADDACATLTPTLTAAPSPAGFTVHGRLAASGLVPAAWAAPRRVALTLEGPATPSQLLAAHDAPFPWPPLTADLTADTPDPVTVTLRVDGAPCATLQLRPRPDALARFHALTARLDALPDAAPLTAGDRASFALLRRRLAALLTAPDAAPDTADRLRRRLDELDALVTAAEAGRPPWSDRTGVVTRAYVSELDGQLRPYVLWVPPAYARRPDRDFPLVVASHGLGYSPEDTLRITAGVPTRPGDDYDVLTTPIRHARALVVAPSGYGDVGHRPPGELDVLRVVDEVRAAYRVDPRGVSITGFSLGGTVAFTAALHHPDRFAAAAPLCGYPNIQTATAVRGARKHPWEGPLLALKDIANHVESGLHLPLRIVHGRRDGPFRSKGVADRYARLGYDAQLDVPDLGHNVWDYAYADGKLLGWLASRRVPAHPASVRLRTGSYRYDRSHWVRLDVIADPLRHAEVDARRAGARVTVRTTNVAALTLDAPRMAASPLERLALVVDGHALPERAGDAPLHLVRADGAWAFADAPPDARGRKRHGVSGPLDDLWYRPFVVVYGTRDPAQTEANRLTAEALRAYSPWADLRMPVLADTEVRPDDLTGRGVVLVGNPASNAVTASVADRLPVRFEPDALTLGGRRFAGADVGVSLIHSSPFDPDQYVVLHAGVTAEGTLSARYLPEHVPDFLVYDARMRAEFWNRVLDPRVALAGGFFGPGWEAPDLRDAPVPALLER